MPYKSIDTYLCSIPYTEIEITDVSGELSVEGMTEAYKFIDPADLRLHFGQSTRKDHFEVLLVIVPVGTEAPNFQNFGRISIDSTESRVEL